MITSMKSAQPGALFVLAAVVAVLLMGGNNSPRCNVWERTSDGNWTHNGVTVAGTR